MGASAAQTLFINLIYKFSPGSTATADPEDCSWLLFPYVNLLLTIKKIRHWLLRKYHKGALNFFHLRRSFIKRLS